LLPREVGGAGETVLEMEVMVGSTLGVGRRPPWDILAARMGWRGPRGVVLAPVAMVTQQY